MAVIVVEVISPVQSSVVNNGSAAVVEVVNVAGSAITTVASVSAVEVLGNNLVQNAVVSETPPANPYQGQVWIDIS